MIHNGKVLPPPPLPSGWEVRREDTKRALVVQGSSAYDALRAAQSYPGMGGAAKYTVRRAA
jgi:hypothetical protein